MGIVLSHKTICQEHKYHNLPLQVCCYYLGNKLAEGLFYTEEHSMSNLMVKLIHREVYAAP